MRRQTVTLLNLGISIALIAGTIWFLVNHQNSFGFGNAHWIMPHHMTIGGGGMGIIMTFFWISVIAAIAIVVSSLVTGRRSEGSQKNKKPFDVLEILKNRYYRGEIDYAPYQTMKRELE
ncbi:hypothetical protein DSCW_48240 [Desulfosarcina widdelii]|uniref:SHOCT domain-containing protein n=1 Tax=Desulfosarcina widdelii TaxID=947919 RepID=A0A5K7ZMS8_9BACT|nr:hypothetical protein [Desulfosarcina widdelii]BBO77407.1 hypothetical protein DSCW_48240 [Desulfosarcina widdelii]